MPAPALHSLPPDVAVEKTSRGVRFRLPQRKLGRARLAGLLPIIFGLGFIAFPLSFLASTFGDVLERPSVFHLFIALFFSIFVFAGLKPVKYGMLLFCGRCTIHLDREWLRAVDSAGPFRHVRRARIEDLRGFDVKVSEKAAPDFLRKLESLGALEGRFDETAKPMPVALGYDRQWLLALGNELKRRIDEARLVSGKAPLEDTQEVAKALPDVANGSAESAQAQSEMDLAPLAKPLASKARLEEYGQGATVVLPAPGVWRGSRGLMVFSIFWCAFMVVFTGGVTLGSSKRTDNLVPFLIFIVLFWLIGIGMMLSAINLGRRRALLSAAGTELRVAQESLFGKKLWRWDRNEITAIRVDRSGMEVNDRPVLELQIHTATRRKTGLFAGRDEAELHWLASVLRRKLAVPASAEQIASD